MKRIKMLVLCFLFLFLFSGCTAKYEVTIEDGKVLEDFTILNQDVTTWKDDVGGIPYAELIDRYVDFAPPVFDYLVFGGDELTDDEKDALTTYKTKKISSSDALGINLSYPFNIKDYLDSTILNYYLDDLTIDLSEDNILTLSTTSSWNILKHHSNLDQISIILHTNHYVLDQNADEHDKGTYTWNITRDYIAHSKGIRISLDLNRTKSYFPDYIIWIFLIIFLLGILIVAYRFYQKSIAQNKL